MSNVSEWSTSAASNNSASPNGAPEGMAPGGVNDTMREMMAAVARWFGDAQGSLLTSGTGAAYTLTTNNSNAALGDIGLLVFRVHAANTGTSATLAVDGLTAKSLRAHGSTTLEAGILAKDELVAVAYNSTNDAFDILGKFNVLPTNATNLTSGTLPDARLSSNVPLIDGTNAFTGTNTFGGVNVTDYARLSQSNKFAEGASFAGDRPTTNSPHVLLDVNGGTPRIGAFDDSDSLWKTLAISGSALLFQISGNTKAEITSSGVLEYGGVEVGYRAVPAVGTKSSDYTFVLADAGKHVLAGSGCDTVTIPANSSVAFPVGTVLTIANGSGSTLSIAITTDTLQLAGTSSTGTRTLAANGLATAIKLTSTVWWISGTGLS